MRLGIILTNAIEISVRPVCAAESGLPAAPLREGAGAACVGVAVLANRSRRAV